MVICCPVAWIDHDRKEILQPFHNSIVPVEEMIAAGITVALGTDNIADLVKPFIDGDNGAVVLLNLLFSQGEISNKRDIEISFDHR